MTLGLMWTYQSRIDRIIDGDTVECSIDLGFRMFRVERVRLLGVDTPELRDRDEALREAAQAAKAYVIAWASTHQFGGGDWPLLLESRKGDSFGRWLGTITCRCHERDLGQELLDTGHAVPY